MTTNNKLIHQINAFQLPYNFKRIGLFVAIIALVILFINGQFFDYPVLQFMAKFALLIGMLIISLAKERIEDERTMVLRLKSYRFAFIVSIGYALGLPFLEYVVDTFRDNVQPTLQDNGDFIILWLLLSIQVLSFEYLNRTA